MKQHNYKFKWSELTFRDKLSYLFAVACFSLGWIITFIAFFIEPIGTVADSILWILSQSLLFTGCIVGIGQFYNAQMQNFKYEVKKFIKSKDKELNEDDLNDDI